MKHDAWEKIGCRASPSWYMDPLVARQKGQVHLQAVRRWTAGLEPRRILKTDLFEEAFGEDQILVGLSSDAGLVRGMDTALSTVLAATKRLPVLANRVIVTDIRSAAFRHAAFDLIVSTSTLDHFESRQEYLSALRELGRILAPGGLLVLTLDNPLNPLYYPLKWFSRMGVGPFPLGYTPSPAALREDLARLGLELRDHAWLIHNPRGVSTLLILMLRRLLKARADAPIGALLRLFNYLDRWPTRRFTACFLAVLAVKLPGPDA